MEGLATEDLRRKYLRRKPLATEEGLATESGEDASIQWGKCWNGEKHGTEKGVAEMRRKDPASRDIERKQKKTYLAAPRALMDFHMPRAVMLLPLLCSRVWSKFRKVVWASRRRESKRRMGEVVEGCYQATSPDGRRMNQDATCLGSSSCEKLRRLRASSWMVVAVVVVVVVGARNEGSRGQVRAAEKVWDKHCM